MTAGYLDTNVLVAFFDGQPYIRQALERFSPLRVPAVAYAEFLVGLTEAECVAVDPVIHKIFDVIQTDNAICHEASKVRREARLKLIDAMIYATARVGGGVLITCDKDFDKSWPDVYIPE